MKKSKLFDRFTMLADDIIMRVESTKVFGEEEDEKRVSCFLHICHFCFFFQMLILKLRRYSQISACGFFTVDRSLVTSFLSTTFTYWVILVQFTQTVKSS